MKLKPSPIKPWPKFVRIVLDTNILVSALIKKEGPAGRLLEAVRNGHFTLVTSDYQIGELQSVLPRPHLRISPTDVEELFKFLKATAVFATDLPDINVSPDPKDNPILATGVAGRVDRIVSGDKSGMLDLGDIEGIPIISLRVAVEQLQQAVTAKGVHEPAIRTGS